MTWAPQFVPEKLDDAALRRLLPALVGANVDYLRKYPNTPSVYTVRPVYVADPPGREKWLTIPHIIQRRTADCKSLSAWRAAELRVSGIDARCVWTIIETCDGPLVHVRVCVPPATPMPPNLWPREDPSAILGMGWLNPG